MSAPGVLSAPGGLVGAGAGGVLSAPAASRSLTASGLGRYADASKNNDSEGTVVSGVVSQVVSQV